MIVNRLDMDGFRNLSAGCFLPETGVNIIYGDNAQGKTNLLEALWLFTGGRSFRGAKDAELPGFGRENAALSLEFEAFDRRQQAQIAIEKRRSAVLNGVPQGSASKLAGVFCAVVFSPSHLSLVRDGPEGRRKFIDAAVCQLRPGYIRTYTAFSRALAQRNALLKVLRKTGGGAEELDVWDQRLAETGARVITARHQYCRRLEPVAAAIYDGLSGGREKLQVGYASAVGYDGDDAVQAAGCILAALRDSRQADMAAGFSTTGPHRDDLITQINGLSARQYGSQGQQRSAVLALKLAEASLLKEVSGEQPVALLDDVMSELDVSRQDYIFNHIHGWQVFITCCEPAAVLRLSGGGMFHVKRGVITKEQ